MPPYLNDLMIVQLLEIVHAIICILYNLQCFVRITKIIISRAISWSGIFINRSFRKLCRFGRFQLAFFVFSFVTKPLAIFLKTRPCLYQTTLSIKLIDLIYEYFYDYKFFTYQIYLCLYV